MEKEWDNVIVRKSFEFAVEVFEVVRELRLRGVEKELLSQLLRSGASIGALVNEAQETQSRQSFLAKMNIALKEAKETEYWLRLLEAAGKLPLELVEKLLKDADELNRLLVNITKSTREALEKQNSQ